MSKEDDAYRFDVAGPKRQSFNWDVQEDKRAILACLTAGVYALEYDRVKKYTGTDKQVAPPWWTYFNYELVDCIVGKDKLRINGAVFTWNHAANLWRPGNAPGVILAFRGTTSLTSDYIIDYKIANLELHKTGRFTAAYNALKNAVSWHGRENVCVTGHSLGAALALSAARKMASEEGQFVEAHLFNPPFSSLTAPLKTVLGAGVYTEILEAYTVAKVGLVNLLVDPERRRQSEAAFLALSGWYPNLYVNTRDPVCTGFVEHFRNYSYLLAGKHGRLVMPHESIRGVIFSSSAKPHHLIPSARLHVPMDLEDVVKTSKMTAIEAHSITQWWSSELQVQQQIVNLTGQEHLELSSD